MRRDVAIIIFLLTTIFWLFVIRSAIEQRVMDENVIYLKIDQNIQEATRQNRLLFQKILEKKSLRVVATQAAAMGLTEKQQYFHL